MEKQFNVYAPGQRYNSAPLYRVSKAEAEELIANGFAKSVNRGKAIEFFALRAVRLRDRSCSWSHRLMDLIAEGNFAACEMLRWMEKRAA